MGAESDSRAASPSPTRAPWPIVGREEELGLLEASIAGGASRAVVLCGAPGVGKSRLLEEALRRAGDTHSVERVRATSAASSLPFGAFASLPLVPGNPAAGRFGLIRELASLVVERAAGRRLVLGVDDAHLLDDASAALVHHLAETGTAFVIAGVRSGEPAPDAVAGLWKEGLGDRFDLAPLSRAETAELLEAFLGGPVDGSTRRRIWEATAGNPLYLRELLRGAADAGDLDADGGVWRWRGGVRIAPRLAELLDERLGTLGPAEREALELVAIGEPIGTELLGDLIGREVLVAVERGGLLEIGSEQGGEQVRLVHPLYGELLRARAPRLVARDHKRRLAAAFERGGAEGRDLLRVASWRLESATPERPEVLVAASRQAAAAFDYGLAERLARAAVEAGGGFAARQSLAEAEIGRGGFATAEATLAVAWTLCDTEAERTRNALARADNLYWRLGRADAAVAVIEAAEAAVEAEPARDALIAERAAILLFGGRTAAATDLASTMAARADPRQAAAWQAGFTAAWGLACAGRFEASVALLDRFLGLAAQRPGDLSPLSPLLLLQINRFSALGFAGSFEAAIADGEATYEEALAAGAESPRAIAALALGWVARLRGTPTTATRWLREAVGELREVDLFRHLSAALGELTQAEALLGNVAAAESALAEAEAARIECFRMDEWAIGLGRAWVAAARGETSSAIAAAREAAERTGELGQRFFQALCLHDALRLGETAVAEELISLCRGLDGELAAAFAAHAAARAEGEGEALEAAAARFRAMGARLYAAEAEAVASRALADQGRAESARAAAARAAVLRERCEGALTPALAGLAAPALSRRQREIATLAARGLSNREIAARLVVSVRTVENHLYNVYVKLGVAGRRELAGPLGIE